MELFPKSDKNIFRRRIVMRKDSEVIETPSTKGRLLQWEKASRHQAVNNETALDKEMEQTLGQMHDFLHHLEVATLVHNKKKRRSRDWATNHALECELKDRVVLAHSLMGKTKELLDLEYTGMRLSESHKSMPSRSLATVNDFSRESESNLSTCSRYGTDIKDVLQKFHKVLGNSSTSLPFVIDQETVEEKKPLLLPASGVDSLKFLTEYLAADNIQPAFKLQPEKASDSRCTVTCTVCNVTVEGKASEKVAAKKAAAARMLERLVDDALKERLPAQITAFTDAKLKEAVAILCESEPYDDALVELCMEWRKPMPKYDTLCTQPQLRLRCIAMGLHGTGKHRNRLVAKRIAARDVLLQFREKPKY